MQEREKISIDDNVVKFLGCLVIALRAIDSDF